MGKAKRATRKELEEVISDIIQELNSLRNMMNYVGFYIEWKGDKISYDEALKKKISEVQGRTQTSSTDKSNGKMEKGNVKSEKKDRYKKISTPL